MRLLPPSLASLVCFLLLALHNNTFALLLPTSMLATRRLFSRTSIVVASTSGIALRRFTGFTMSASSTVLHSKPKVLVPVADGSEEIEAVTIIDTLVRGGAEVTVASVSESLTVVCSRGVKLTSDCSIRDCVDKSWDMVVCPGGMPGAQHLSDCPTLTEILKQQIESSGYVAAICASPAVVLARHNFLTDKRATCYPVEKFTSKLHHYLNEKVVIDGNIITSQGPGTSLDFSLALVEILCGNEKASALKKEMLHHH